MRAVHHLEQGSPEWKAHRATPNMFNGSEIAAILGIDKKTSRSELLRMKALGNEKEFSDYVQNNVIDRGHENEALARPMAEELIGDDLSALVMTDTIDGLLFSVSLDGITQTKDITFEHKSLNALLADALDAGTLPEEYHPQCEAGLMVSGATRCLFMATKDGDMKTARKIWYESRPELRPRIIAACKQFSEDLANYVHVEREAAPVAATIEALPALFVQVEGKVLATNLDAFKAKAQTFIDSIKTELVNDQDFADAAKMVKFLEDGEGRLDQAKAHALSQTASIDELFRTVDAISEQMRSKRLALEKLVKAEKINRKAAIIAEAHKAIEAHTVKLNERIGGNWMPPTNGAVRFAEATAGLKSLDSMRDKVDAVLANAKIEANEIADRIDANRQSMADESGDWSFLIPDFAAVCTKQRDDFDALLVLRITKHNEAQAAKDKAAKDAEEARTAAAVAAAVEAERMAEAKRVADEAAKTTASAYTAMRDNPPPTSGMPESDQRGKADAGSNASGEAADVGSIPHPVTASTPPIQADESAIDDFIRLLSIGAVEKKALRVNILKWEKYRVALLMQQEKAA